MEIVLYIFAKIVLLILNVVSFAMFLRILLPIFMDVQESRLYLFATYVTEPFVIPVRYLMVKFNLLQDSPIDWSFTFTYLLLSMIQFMLPII